MRLALDSNVLIAALAGHEKHSLVAQQLVRDIAGGKHQAIASSIAYGEVLGIASKSANELDVQNFFFHIQHFATIAADDDICLKAGQLRRRYGNRLKLPDALHVATALSAGVDVFITNDLSLAKFAQKLLPTKSLASWR
ncbi:MAG: type II toxin-antitoxin system VapC family toxin [Candidatus Saccharimonadales bacterium]